MRRIKRYSKYCSDSLQFFVSSVRIALLATEPTIDPATNSVTLRGAKRTETLDVSPDIPQKKLKLGDSVRAVFVSAAAASVERGGDELKRSASWSAVPSGRVELA